MKTTVLSLTTTFFIAGMLMTGCGDNSKKDSKEVQTDIRETDQQFNQRTEDSRAEARQDWEDFKAASDEELEKREKEIKDLRAKIAKADKRQRTKLNKDLDELDRKNKELKERIATRSNTIKDDLNDLNEKVIKEHKAAQRELKHDMDELGKALGNLFKKNTD